MTTAAPSRALRQRLRDTAMEAMLDAAEAAMIEHGYDKATMIQIAAATGCATGTFYLYFKNKEELFQAIVARHSRMMHGGGREELSKPGKPLDRVFNAWSAMIRYVQQHRAFFRLFFEVVPTRKRGMLQRLSSPVREQQSQYMLAELEVLREAQKAGHIRRDFSAETLQEFTEAVAMSLVEQFVFSTKKTSMDDFMHKLWSLAAGGLAVVKGSHGKR